jgi:hypothetical protein
MTPVPERQAQVAGMSKIKVLKLNPSGKLTWAYEGKLLRREPHAVVLEAFFDRADMSFLDLALRKGDRFVEAYYDSRWYNILEIHDRDDDRLKGWYCNLSRPAVLAASTVSWVDLALDLWVWPDGRQVVLDEDEFNALGIDPRERNHALAALVELRTDFETRRPPW